MSTLASPLLRTRSLMLSSWGFQVLDEVHERTTDAEMLNFLVKRLMESSTVKVVAMSATLQTNVFGNYFTPSSEEVQPAIFVGVKRFQEIVLSVCVCDCVFLCLYESGVSVTVTVSVSVSVSVSASMCGGFISGVVHERTAIKCL